MTMNLYADAFEEVDRQAAASLDADSRQHVVNGESEDDSETSRPRLRLVK